LYCHDAEVTQGSESLKKAVEEPGILGVALKFRLSLSKVNAEWCDFVLMIGFTWLQRHCHRLPRRERVFAMHLRGPFFASGLSRLLPSTTVIL
jgi:hypothetical protein